MFKAILFVLLAATAHAADESLAVDLRYRDITSRENLVDPALLYDRPIFPWAGIELGARVGMSTSSVETFEYKGELLFPILRELRLGARLFQSNQLGDGTGVTQLFFHTDGNVPLFSFLELLATLGWYERYTALQRTFVLPGISHNSFTDQDLALALGFRVRPARDWRGDLAITTFEDFDVFNLNSPAFVLTAEKALPGRALAVFGAFRYRVLLGFGRLAETAFTVGIRWDFAAAGLPP